MQRSSLQIHAKMAAYIHASSSRVCCFWQLIEAKGRIVSCEADAKTLVRKVEHFKKELESKRQSAKTAGKEFQALEVSEAL